MSANIGSVDRAIQIILGLVLLRLLLVVQTDARWLGLIGLVPLVTALFEVSALNAALGMNTGASARRG